MQRCLRHPKYQYESHRRGGSVGHQVSFRITDELGPSTEGSREHFLLERYLLFVQHRDTILTGQVHHQPYHAHLAVVDHVEDSLVASCGLPAINRLPDLVHYSPGVDVEVFGIRSI